MNKEEENLTKNEISTAAIFTNITESPSIGIFNDLSTKINPTIIGTHLFPNSLLTANGSNGITGKQIAYTTGVKSLNIVTDTLPTSSFLASNQNNHVKLASFSPSAIDITGNPAVSSFMPKISPATLLTTAGLPDYKITMREKEEAEKQRKEMNDALAQLKEKQNSNASKDDIEKNTKALEMIQRRFADLDTSNEPEAILSRLPTLMNDFVQYNRLAELQKLKEFFQRNFFFWNCGFGHLVEIVRTLEQLQQIITSQAQGIHKKCKSNHSSYILIADGQLLTVSIEDLARGFIRGSKKKSRSS